MYLYITGRQAVQPRTGDDQKWLSETDWEGKVTSVLQNHLFSC